MRQRRENEGPGGGGGGGYLEELPNSIIHEILTKLDLETLCSASCVSKTLRSSVSQVLSSFTSLDFSAFPPDALTLNYTLRRFRGLKCVAVDCLRLDDSSISRLIGAQIQELNLFKCSSLYYQVLLNVGQCCPNLRVLELELAGLDLPKCLMQNLVHTLKGCSQLESLCIKVRGTEHDAKGFQDIELLLPETIRVLKLQPVIERAACNLIQKPGFSLRCLSLVLDIISDELIMTIVNSLPLLVELDLEDRPNTEPSLSRDLTNRGLQTLASCLHLTHLSLVRSKCTSQATFKRVNDMGIFLLSEGCKGLESVTLGAFSKVSDAGFAAITHSCQNLKHFEVRNASLLSDLAFHDIGGAPCSLVTVRLLSCSLITSDAVNRLAAASNSLEMLDLGGCWSIANHCLGSVARLQNLTTLNIGGSDVTDNGMAALGRGIAPIARLCLRGCKRVTDNGIALLLNGEGIVWKTLSALDLGYMPGISDKAIFTISEVGVGITELCIKQCFYITDESIKKLGSERRKPLRKLDIFHCIALSLESLGLLKKPYFRGLQWVGVGRTRWTSRGGDVGFAEIRRERPWLTVCLDGCEMGCQDAWRLHSP